MLFWEEKNRESRGGIPQFNLRYRGNARKESLSSPFAVLLFYSTLLGYFLAAGRATTRIRCFRKRSPGLDGCCLRRDATTQLNIDPATSPDTATRDR